jgi:hypothetical protein
MPNTNLVPRVLILALSSSQDQDPGNEVGIGWYYLREKTGDDPMGDVKWECPYIIPVIQSDVCIQITEIT